MKLGKTTVGILLALAATVLAAHDLFIKPEGFFLEPDSSVRVPILNGSFDSSENSIAADRVLDVSVTTGGKRRTPPPGSWSAGEDQDTSFLALKTGQAGTYVFGVSTRHRDFDLAAAEFNAYLEHDGIPDVLEARRIGDELDLDVRERYAKHVKAIVQVGDKRTDDFGVRLGYPAEIVPLANPYTTKVGEKLAVLCLVDGEPVAGQPVIAGSQGADGTMAEQAGRTDGSGKIRFTIDRPGSWYVKFIHMARREPGAEVDYESKWATLTFGVK